MVLAERLRKKDVPGNKENKSFFNGDRTFTINERSKLNNNTFLYWLKENVQKIKNRLLRQELFALKNQFVE